MAITAELRGRIRSGDPAPGQRLPSTRAIAREWGVAIGTASRVLAALRAEGLVRVVPGVGTVVADVAPAAASTGAAPPWVRARAPAAEPERVLSVARIVGAAVRVADAEGLAGVTVRRVATELGAAPMALYRHVGDKDDLIDRMLDAALRDPVPSADPRAGWRPRVEPAVRALWSAVRRRPWVAQALAAGRRVPVGTAYERGVLAAVDGHLAPAEAADLYRTLVHHVRGTAVGGEPDLDALFESGLRLLLDGLAARLARAADAAGTTAPPWART